MQKIATRECVHLLRVVTSGHVTKIAATPFDPPLPKNLCYTQTSWLYVLQNRSYGRSKFYIAGIGVFYLFCSCDLDLYPMTFIYESDPYGDIPDVQIWTSYGKAFESYRLTNRQTDRHDQFIHHAASRVVSKCLSDATYSVKQLLLRFQPIIHIPEHSHRVSYTIILRRVVRTQITFSVVQ